MDLKRIDWLLSGGGVSYSTEAQAVFDRMTGLTTDEKDIMAAFIDSQVASGNWSKLGCYQDYELQTFANARLDWFGNFNGEASLISGITHTPGEGLVFSGSQARGFLTNYNTLTDAKWVVNNAILGAYCRDNQSTVDQKIFIGSSSTTLSFVQRTVANRLDFLNVNGISKQITSYPTGFEDDKHYTVMQKTTNIAEVFVESASAGTNAGSASESNDTIYLGGRGDTSGPFVGKIGCFYAGAGVGFDLANFITNRNIMKDAFFLL